MKLVTFSVNTPFGEVVRLGALRKDGYIVDLSTANELRLTELYGQYEGLRIAAKFPGDMLAFIRDGQRARDSAEEAMHFARNMGTEPVGGLNAVFDSASVRILSPLPRPSSIRCFSLSETHMLNSIASMQDTASWGIGKPAIAELAPEWYNLPAHYKNVVSEIYGPDDVVPWPALTDKFDYELEVAVVIGGCGRHIAAGDAQKYIYGYTLYNDWSARDFQQREMSINLGPALCKDNASSLGPCIVTADEYDPMGKAFSIKVNGHLIAETKLDLYHSLSSIIEYTASVQTLFPGDIFTTGTLPNGCGGERKQWLAQGDIVEFQGEGIGTLRNIVGAKGADQQLPASQRTLSQIRRTCSM